jgi:hypothetical protein
MSTDGPSGQPDEKPDRPREGRRPGEPADHRASVQAEPETRTRQEYYDILSSGRGQEIVGFAALMAERPASERHEWQILLSRGEVGRCGLGVIDERAKRFSAAERRIAEHLADPGPAVVSVSEGFGIYGRTADARVNGIPVEFKSLDPGAAPAAAAVRLPRAGACGGLSISSWCTTFGSPTRIVTGSGRDPAAEAGSEHDDGGDQPGQRYKCESTVVRPVKDAVLLPAGVTNDFDQAQQAGEDRAAPDPACDADPQDSTLS